MSRPVAEETVDELYQKAREMSEKKRRRMRVTGACVGILRTEWKRSTLGSMSGIEFIAEVADKKGEVTLTFIMRSFDLENPVWVGHGSIEESDLFEAELEAHQHKRRGRLN